MMQYAMIIIALATLVVLVWMEMKRLARPFLLLRLLASITAVIAMLFLVVPFPYSLTTSSKKEIILLSEGYNKDSVDQFLKTADQSFQQFQLNNISFQQIADVNTIHLFGNGFKDTNQLQLPNIPIVFHASDKQTGIQNIHWQESVVTGTALLVQGSCLNLSNKTAKLVLYGWKNRVDSIEIGAGKQQRFSFSVVPENEGRGLYHLTLLAGKDSLEKETIAYQVRPAKALKVLMLGASPDFETKFLKNWLADFGYTVISKNSISKEKYQKTYSNARQFYFEKVTTALLEEQDLIVSDEAAIQTLSATELAIVKQAISENGIGLILNVDSLLSKKNFINEIFSIKSADSNKASIKISKLGESNTTSPINLKHPFQIIENDGTQPLFIDQQKRVFASVAAYGKGKLLVNTVQKTSSWLLSGNKNDYRNYWTTLINQSARKETTLEAWNIKTELPRIDETIAFAAQISSGNTPQLSIKNNELYPKQNELLPGFWDAIYWPEIAGWQTMIGTKGELRDWYVYTDRSWKAIYANKQINQTKAYLKNRLSDETKKIAHINRESQIPPIYLFLIFLLSMAFLWVERKFQ